MVENSLPPHILSMLKDYLHMPVNYDDDESIGFLINEGAVKLLGSPTNHRLLDDDSKSALTVLLSGSQNSQADPTLNSPINFGKFRMYPRFKMLSSQSVFTTTAYTLSPKRLNYCAMMKVGTFIFIDKIICFDAPPVIGSTSSFVLCRPLGTILQESFTPDPVKGVVFNSFPDQTKKLTGIGKVVAYEISAVSHKCVVAMKSDLIEKYIVTGLVNNMETD